MSDELAQIGVIGMAVMGSNLARNFANHGYRTAIFNRTYAKTAAVVEAHPEANFVASEKLEDFVASLETPRRIIIMVKAGAGTDATIDCAVTTCTSSVPASPAARPAPSRVPRSCPAAPPTPMSTSAPCSKTSPPR